MAMRRFHVIRAYIVGGAAVVALIGVLVLAGTPDPDTSQSQSQRSSPGQPQLVAQTARRDELVQGTLVDPATLVEEGTFTAQGEARRVFTGHTADGMTCLIVRNGASRSDGGDTCARDLFEMQPAALLESFSADPAGRVTRYELTALLGPLARSLSVVDSLGRAHTAELQGRVAFYALSPADIALGTRLTSAEIYGEGGRLLASTPIVKVP